VSPTCPDVSWTLSWTLSRTLSRTCPGQAHMLEKPIKIAFWALSRTVSQTLSRTPWGLSRTLSRTAPMVFQTVPGHFGTMCWTKFSAQCSVHLDLYIARPKFDSPRGQGKLRADFLPTIQPILSNIISNLPSNPLPKERSLGASMITRCALRAGSLKQRCPGRVSRHCPKLALKRCCVVIAKTKLKVRR